MQIIFGIARFVKYFFISQYMRARYLLQINRSKIRIFNKDVLKDKRIIIIGPASSAMSYMSGKNIDKFDFIVRVNNIFEFFFLFYCFFY